MLVEAISKSGYLEIWLSSPNPPMALFLLVLSLCWVISAGDSPKYTGLIRNVTQITGNKVADCEAQCRADGACEAFYLLQASNTSLEVTNTTIFDCYLLSAALHTTLKAWKDDSTVHCFGTKLPINHTQQASLSTEALAAKHILLKDPVAISPFTMLAYPVHLQAGCSYTLSLYFWIHPPRQPYPEKQIQSILFAKPIFPHSPEGMLLPSILHNVGRQPDALFLASSQRIVADFLGLWLTPVKYSTWIHVAFSISSSKVEMFVDGKYVDYLVLGTDLHCMPPDTQSMHVRCADSNRSISEFISTPRIADNVLLKLGSASQVTNSIGLVASLLVLPGALNDTEIRVLREITRPTANETLSALLTDAAAAQVDDAAACASVSPTGTVDGSSCAQASTSLISSKSVLLQTVQEGVPDIGILLPHDQRLQKISADPSTPSDLTNPSEPATERTAERLWKKLHSYLTGLLLQPVQQAEEEGAAMDLSHNEQQYVNWLADRNSSSYYLSHPIGKVQGLYLYARHILHAMDLNLTQQQRREACDMALLQALLEATAIDLSHPEDNGWVFKTASHLVQPILLMLGYHNGFDDLTHELPWEEMRNDGPKAIEKVLEAVELLQLKNISLPSNISLEEVYNILIGKEVLQTVSSVSTVKKKHVWGGPAKPVPNPSIVFPEDHKEVTIADILEAFGNMTSEEDFVAKAEGLEKRMSGIMNVSEIVAALHPAQPPQPAPSTAINKADITLLEELWANHSHYNCHVAASYYFPIAQYVGANYGEPHSGAGVLDDVRISQFNNGQVTGFGGEDDQQHSLSEVDAHAGDPNAQVWLGKKYFWGLGGLQRNEDVARFWFERAAEQGHAEGLYNVGSLHHNGDAGLIANGTKALEYFNRSANAESPFPMALNAMGNHYMYHAEAINYTEAKRYFLTAALLGSEDAIFSLAVMFKEGFGGETSIPTAVTLFAAAATLGHVRSMNYIAHALFDAESWLAHYGREQALLQTYSAYSSGLTAVIPKAETDELSLKDFVGNGSRPIKIRLPDDIVITLPFPLGSVQGSCQAALPLLRHLAQKSYRPKDLIHIGMQEYLQGSYASSVQAYEEAADLGVHSAQNNVAYLYEESILPLLCNNASSTEASQLQVTNLLGAGPEQCRGHLNRLSLQRHMQLARKGELDSLRKIAQSVLRHNDLGLRINTSEVMEILELTARKGCAESIVELGWLHYYGYDGKSLLLCCGGVSDGCTDVSGNVSKALEVFQQAMALEVLGRPYHNSTKKIRLHHREHTAGVAPAIAMLTVAVDQALQGIGYNLTYAQQFCGHLASPVANLIGIPHPRDDLRIILLSIVLTVVLAMLLVGWNNT